MVRVSINSEPKGDFFVFRTGTGDVYLKADDLKTLGISAEAQGATVQLDGEAHVSLKSLPGVTFSLNDARAELQITADARLLPRRVYDLSGKAKPTGIVPSGSSAFFNYALDYANGDTYARPRLGFTAEAGARRGDALLLSNGATIERGDGSRKFVRLMSSLMWDDRQKLQRTVVGDFHTPARDFSVGANVAGISFSKLYDINPYLVHYPTQTIRGNVALPSDLEVYVDGQRIRSERLAPGEFELRDLTGHRGARSVQLVLRDSFGRVQQLGYAFYVSDQPLREGFHEYSYNLGALRRSFGTESNRYGTPAYSMFHRVGLTDVITLGLRAEGTREFFNAGPSATVVLGSAGVLNAALARSSVRGWGGRAASLFYTYEGGNWSLGAGVRREWDTFTVLGEPLSATNRKVEAHLSASVHLGRSGSASISHHKLRINDASSNPPAGAPFAFSALAARRETSLTYSLPLVSGKSSLNASVRHIKDANGSRNEVFVGLLYFPDREHILNTSVRAASDNSHSESLQFSKNQPYGEGLGYTVSADRVSSGAAHSTQLRSSAQYNAPAFLLRGELNQTRAARSSDTEHRLAVAGGIGYVGERISFGRPITDSFALVKVGEIPGVAITVNGLDAGRTNARGEAFVPSLRAYYDNEVALNAPDIPIEQSIETLKARVSPSPRSGVLLSFAPTKIQAITGKLLLVRTGGPEPLENQLVAVTVQDKRHNFRTGRGGEFYVENIPAGRYAAEATTPQGRCRFELLIPQSNEVFLELPPQLCQPAR